MRLGLTVTSLAIAAVTAAAQSEAGNRGPFSSDAFVVTDARLVEAANRAAALDICQAASSEFTSAGIDWGKGPDGGLVHLCQRRQPLGSVGAEARVLQRIEVFANATSCPSPRWTLLRVVQGNAVCVAFAASASDALAHKNYISDITVTSARNYNNDGPGWTTIPWSLGDSPANGPRGVFLSYRRPVAPITALHVAKDVPVDGVDAVCATATGSSWRQVGSGFLDSASASSKTVLCAEFGRPTIGSSPFRRLVDLAVVATSEDCAAGFTQKQELNERFAICSKWAAAEATAVFVADLDLHRVSPPLDGPDPTASEFLPGKFELVSKSNLNSASPTFPAVYLFARKFQPQIVPTPAPLSKRPLLANLKGGAAQQGQSPKRLTFKILQIADLHYTGDPTYKCRDSPVGVTNCTEAMMTQFVENVLDIEKPDFVVFTGDNVETFAPARRRLAMDAVTNGVEARKIPYGMVFGNHDDENGLSRDELIAMATEPARRFSYTQRGPVEVDGVGNYELSVLAPSSGPWGKGGAEVFRMYFLDSHGYPDRAKFPQVQSSYDWVKPNQIAYYRQLSEAHAATQNRVPAVMFFHIPLVEYNANARSRTHGEQFESVASSEVNTNLFSTLVDMGEVKATFVGHDHVNDYCYKREGIQLCYGGGAGFGQAYGSSALPRRARVIEWVVNERGQRTIRSWKRHWGKLEDRQSEEVLYTEA